MTLGIHLSPSLELLTQVALGEVAGNTEEVECRVFEKQFEDTPEPGVAAVQTSCLSLSLVFVNLWEIHLINSGNKNIYTTIQAQAPGESTNYTQIIGVHHVHTQVKEGA